ncbi:DNA-binding transcriptional regulator YhcF, GntR family [Amphibacillus marinus]|uniref:DNA-binding transcriptional regulator YhcF, GntR family n=1 Tax=Amphibacillus marinus TaxID=872970 RepID=A0A1H8LMT0_9BACI|nr:GntR family transcriptional regulator [Amphibacillus marinus]SEO06397.1 DNA-binding transcriptional regulator YhcF, GntR family [Amphibacillus marinus]
MSQSFQASLTIYKQIALGIENAILEGTVKPGERLASLRESAVELEVNINTIMRAYNILEEEAILFKKRGLGFFVTKDALTRIQQKRKVDFYQQTIPELARTMKQLNIKEQELLAALQNYYQ